MTEATAAKPQDVVNPFTGECYEKSDVDGLVELHEQLAEAKRKIAFAESELRLCFKALAPEPEDTRTARVRGRRRRVKVIHPAESWDSKILAEALNAYPDFGPDYLRIARVEPIAKEVKKLKNESNPTSNAWVHFRQMVLSARREPQGLPRIEVEE